MVSVGLSIKGPGSVLDRRNGIEAVVTRDEKDPASQSNSACPCLGAFLLLFDNRRLAILSVLHVDLILRDVHSCPLICRIKSTIVRNIIYGES